MSSSVSRIPASSAACTSASRIAFGSAYAVPSPGRGAGSGTRRRGVARAAPSRVHSRAPARGTCPARAGRRRRTSAPARSRTCPGPSWVRPRSARWNAWLWSLTMPGMVRPGTGGAGFATGHPVRDHAWPLMSSVGSVSCQRAQDRANRPRSRRAPRSRQRRRPRRARGRTTSRGQSLESVRQGVDAGEAVGGLGVLLRRVADAGRVADEQHRGRDAARTGCRRRGRRRWA